jgi:hypothetical protein
VLLVVLALFAAERRVVVKVEHPINDALRHKFQLRWNKNITPWGIAPSDIAVRDHRSFVEPITGSVSGLSFRPALPNLPGNPPAHSAASRTRWPTIFVSLLNNYSRVASR